MIARLQEWLRDSLGDDTQDDRHRMDLATAVLLLEVARANTDKAEAELDRIMAILADSFSLSDADSHELLALANDESEAAHDLYAFTSVINNALSYDERVTLVKRLWQVAFADGRLDEFEEHIVRRIAGLLHVEHQDFVKMKIGVRDGLT